MLGTYSFQDRTITRLYSLQPFLLAAIELSFSIWLDRIIFNYEEGYNGLLHVEFLPQILKYNGFWLIKSIFSEISNIDGSTIPKLIDLNLLASFCLANKSFQCTYTYKRFPMCTRTYPPYVDK